MSDNSISMPVQDLVQLAADSLKKGGDFTFRSRGQSMMPRIADREKVTISSSNFNDLEIGDIVLCTTKHGAVLHSILNVGCDAHGPYLFIAGDAEKTGEHYVRKQNYIGKVTKIQRNLFIRTKLSLKTFVKKFTN